MSDSSTLPRRGTSRRARFRRPLLIALVALFGGFAAPAVASAADVGISLESMAPLDVGYNEQFTLDVTNYGPGSTAGVMTVSATLPAGLTMGSVSGTGWSCTQGTTFTCTRSSPLAQGYISTILLQAVPTAAAVPTVILNFGVSLAGDTNPTNDTSSIVQAVHYFDDVSLTVGHVGNFTVGNTEQLRLVVTNLGDNDTDGPITITDQLPPGLTYAGSSGAEWTCASDGAQLVTCTTIRSKSTGQNFGILTLKVAVGPAAAPGAGNSATVHYPNDQNPTNDTGTDVIPIPYATDFGLGWVGPTTAPAVGVQTSFGVAVSRIGRLATTGTTTVSFAIPPSLQVLSAKGTGWICTPGQSPVCTTPAPKSSFGNIAITAIPAAAAAPGVPITVALATDGDGNPANNVFTVPFGVAPSCIVPKIKGQTANSAAATLSASGCTLGRKSGQKRKKRGYKVVVKAQKTSVGTVLPYGSPVGVSMKLKKKH